MSDIGVLVTILVAGIIFGALTSGTIIYLKTKLQIMRAMKKIEKKELVFEGKKGLEAFIEKTEQESIVEENQIREPQAIQEVPKQELVEDNGLQPCLICGLRSQTNTCSVEHYHQAMVNYHTLQSEESRESITPSNKEGEVKSLKDVSDSTPSS